MSRSSAARRAVETEWVDAGAWFEAAEKLKAEGWTCVALAGLDGTGLNRDPRFEVVVQLLHQERRQRMTVHVPAPGEPPTVPSVTGVWPVVNFPEREAFDMFGIHFERHPDLTRILMPDEWEGHPLRKDYGVGKVPIEFIPQPFLQARTSLGSPDPDEADAELDELGQVVDPSAGQRVAMNRAAFARATTDPDAEGDEQ